MSWLSVSGIICLAMSENAANAGRGQWGFWWALLTKKGHHGDYRKALMRRVINKSCAFSAAIFISSPFSTSRKDARAIRDTS